MIAIGIALWLVGWIAVNVLKAIKDDDRDVLGERWFVIALGVTLTSLGAGFVLTVVGVLRWLWLVAP